jgi:hypothetical protein
MKKGAIYLLQFAVLLLGFVVLAALIRLPLTEGRAINLDLFHIYTDPFILYGYATSIPFFFALFMAFKLLTYIEQSQLYSLDAIAAVIKIRYCVIVFSIFTFIAGVLIVLFHDKEDDPAGFISLCIMTIMLSIFVAIMAFLFEKKIRKAIALKTKKA